MKHILHNCIVLTKLQIVDGQWSEWVHVSLDECKENQNGTWTRPRHRTCNNPEPKFNGQDCPLQSGNSSTTICHPVNGNWSDQEWMNASERGEADYGTWRLRACILLSGASSTNGQHWITCACHVSRTCFCRITAFTSYRTNLSPFTKGCREWDASMWLLQFLRGIRPNNNVSGCGRAHAIAWISRPGTRALT